MPSIAAPLEIDGQPLYKALGHTDKDAKTLGVEIVTVDAARSTDAAPYVRVMEKSESPAPLIAPASQGLLDVSRWRLVPLTGRNKAEREIHQRLVEIAEARAARRRERLAAFEARQREIARNGPAIVRSPGIPIAGTVYSAGGGYSGKTEQLDALVRDAAQMLLETFGQDVVIRFNSDRRSGGAYVVTDAVDGLDSNAEIGLGADLTVVAEMRRRRRRLVQTDAEADARVRQTLADDGYDPDNPPESYLTITANIGSRALLNPEVANRRLSDDDRRRAYATFATLADGLAFLKANARRPEEIAPLA